MLDRAIIPSACKVLNNFVSPTDKTACCQDRPAIICAMTPVSYLDILRRTKKNNCGKCGHPTCMAFAVAVAKTGADPGRCPYLDLTGLPAAAPEAETIDDLARQRDLTLIDHLRTKVSHLDFAALTGPLGVRWSDNDPDTLYFSYLDHAVRFGRNTILLDGAEPEDPRDQILLYNYISSGGGHRPANDWLGLESLPNSISKVKTLEKYSEKRLAELFSGRKPEWIYGLCQKLGGIADPDAAASLGVIIPVLPMVPHYLLFWEEEPEDGFAARVKLLFDRHVLDFLDLESLVFSAERLADRLAELTAVT